MPIQLLLLVKCLHKGPYLYMYHVYSVFCVPYFIVWEEGKLWASEWQRGHIIGFVSKRTLV